MSGPIFMLIVMTLGFVAGYVVRAKLSRKRRAEAREEWLRIRDQTLYDEGRPVPGSIELTIG